MEMRDRRWGKCRARRRKVGTKDYSDLSDLDDSLDLGWGEAGKPETWSLARLRGFAVFQGVCSLFINELDEKVFTTSGSAGDGDRGNFGWWLRRQLKLELADEKLEFRLGLGVASQPQLPPVGRRQMNIDHLHGGEFLQGTARGQSRRQGMQTALQGDL
jgi:hypothetical protein